MSNKLDFSKELIGRRALVTGGTRGIGAAIAQRLLDAGAKVVVTARSRGEALPAGATFVAGDVASVAGVKAIAAGALDALGGLDILVNNAGGASGFPQGTASIPDEAWQASFALNLFAAIRLTNALLPALRESKAGAIVNISSGAATMPIGAIAHYGAAKAALNSYSRSLATRSRAEQDPRERRVAGAGDDAREQGVQRRDGRSARPLRQGHAARSLRGPGGHGGGRRVARVGSREVDDGREHQRRRRNDGALTTSRCSSRNVPRVAAIHHAATLIEAQLCVGEEVGVVGGGNSAGQAALYLSKSSARVHLLVRHKNLSTTMSNYLVESVERPHTKIQVYFDTELTALAGRDSLENVEWRSADGRSWTKPIRNLFVMIGAVPNTEWLNGCVELDSKGYIVTNPMSPFETVTTRCLRCGRCESRIFKTRCRGGRRRLCRDPRGAALPRAGELGGRNAEGCVRPTDSFTGVRSPVRS